MAVDTAVKRWSMMGFGSMGGWIPLPDGELDAVDRLTLLGLYAGILASAPPIVPGKAHRKRLRPAPAQIDAEKVRQDWINRVALREEMMWANRIQHEEASRRILVSAMLSADSRKQQVLHSQIRVIEARIRDLQAHSTFGVPYGDILPQYNVP